MDLITQLLQSKHDLDSFAKKIPCMLHINDASNFEILYLDPVARKKIGIAEKSTPNDLKGSLTKIVHPDDLQAAINSCKYYLKHIDEFSTVSFLQRVELKENQYRLMYTTSLLIEELGGLVSFSIDLGEHLVNEKQVNQINNETNFIKMGFVNFGTLTQKEKNLIKLWVQDFSNREIAEKLTLTEQTVKTYKKKIYKKLEINTFNQLHRYASAFDLIH